MDPRDAFLERAKSGGIVPVIREVVTDADTPVAAFAKIARPPFAFLLESLVGGERWARYTFLGTEPREAWRYRGQHRTTPRGPHRHARRARRGRDDCGLARDSRQRVRSRHRRGERRGAREGVRRAAAAAVRRRAGATRHLDRAPERDASARAAVLGRRWTRVAAAPAIPVRASGVRARCRQDPRVHRRGRRLPGRPVAPAGRARCGRPPPTVSLPARPEPRSLSLLPHAR